MTKIVVGLFLVAVAFGLASLAYLVARDWQWSAISGWAAVATFLAAAVIDDIPSRRIR